MLNVYACSVVMDDCCEPLARGKDRKELTHILDHNCLQQVITGIPAGPLKHQRKPVIMQHLDLMKCHTTAMVLLFTAHHGRADPPMGVIMHYGPVQSWLGALFAKLDQQIAVAACALITRFSKTHNTRQGC
jgi:hypothetical protein